MAKKVYPRYVGDVKQWGGTRLQTLMRDSAYSIVDKLNTYTVNRLLKVKPDLRAQIKAFIKGQIKAHDDFIDIVDDLETQAKLYFGYMYCVGDTTMNCYMETTKSGNPRYMNAHISHSNGSPEFFLKNTKTGINTSTGYYTKYPWYHSLHKYVEDDYVLTDYDIIKITGFTPFSNRNQLEQFIQNPDEITEAMKVKGFEDVFKLIQDDIKTIKSLQDIANALFKMRSPKKAVEFLVECGFSEADILGDLVKKEEVRRAHEATALVPAVEIRYVKDLIKKSYPPTMKESENETVPQES